MFRLPFHSLSDFLNMGGYAQYVWLAFGLVIAVLGTTVYFSCRAHNRFIQYLTERDN